MDKKDSPNIGHNKKSLLNSPVEHIDIKSFDARKIIEGMGKMSFTSRDTARAAAIYAEAFSKDPEFYEFTRSMRAYDATFNNKSDVLVIDPKSDFFKYLNKSKGNN